MRRRLAKSGWLCAVVLAVLAGVWSFQNANPDGRYPTHDPLDEAAVRHELERGGSAGTSGGSGSASPSGAPSSAPPSSSPPASSPSGARTVALKLPPGVATASVQCLADGRIKMLSLSPAPGYSADDVVHGPGKYVTFELKPPEDSDDDDGEDDDATEDPAAEDSDDLLVRAHCSRGKPLTSVIKD